jgi:DNA-binding protein H-NS
MSDQEATLTQIQSLADALKKATKALQRENANAADAALKEVRSSIQSLEELIDYDKALRDAIVRLVTSSQDNRLRLVQKASALPLSESEINQISLGSKAIESYETVLIGLIRSISLQIINQAVKDIEQPGQRILSSTRKVQAAITKLENLNKQIEFLSKIVNVFQSIIDAAANGIPALIGTVLDEIDKL